MPLQLPTNDVAFKCELAVKTLLEQTNPDIFLNPSFHLGISNDLTKVPYVYAYCEEGEQDEYQTGNYNSKLHVGCVDDARDETAEDHGIRFGAILDALSIDDLAAQLSSLTKVDESGVNLLAQFHCIGAVIRTWFNRPDGNQWRGQITLDVMICGADL